MGSAGQIFNNLFLPARGTTSYPLLGDPDDQNDGHKSQQKRQHELDYGPAPPLCAVATPKYRDWINRVISPAPALGLRLDLPFPPFAPTSHLANMSYSLLCPGPRLRPGGLFLRPTRPSRAEHFTLLHPRFLLSIPERVLRRVSRARFQLTGRQRCAGCGNHPAASRTGTTDSRQLGRYFQQHLAGGTSETERFTDGRLRGTFPNPILLLPCRNHLSEPDYNSRRALCQPRRCSAGSSSRAICSRAARGAITDDSISRV